MRLRFTLGEKDRERYGGPEWVHLDTSLFDDMDYEQLRTLEKDMWRHDRLSLTNLLLLEWPAYTLLGVRAMSWLARQLSSLTEPSWADFKPNPLKTNFQLVQDDGGDEQDPPQAGSSEPPSEKPARSKKVSTS